MTQKLLTFLAVMAAVGFSTVQASEQSTPDETTVQPQGTPPTTALENDAAEPRRMLAAPSVAPGAAAVCPQSEEWADWAANVSAGLEAQDKTGLLALFKTMTETLDNRNAHATLLALLTGATEDDALNVAEEALALLSVKDDTAPAPTTEDDQPEETPAPGSRSTTSSDEDVVQREDPTDETAPAPTGDTGTAEGGEKPKSPKAESVHSDDENKDSN